MAAVNIHCALRFNRSIGIRRNWKFMLSSRQVKNLKITKKKGDSAIGHCYQIFCRVRVVCALLRIFPLSTQWPITVLDGAESLKGSQRMGDGRTLPLIKVYRMSPISCGSILLNSTLTTVQFCSFWFPFIFTSFVRSLFRNPQ